MRIDHASASARSASRMASLARSRALSARILAPAIREPNMTCRDLVLMAGNTAALASPRNATRIRYRERPHGPTGGTMCNLYSITTNQAAIIALFRVMNRYVGNLPVFPDY